MSCRRYYQCDLCGADIKQDTGIGVHHETMGAMKAVFFSNENAGHHLCNKCVKGLRDMLADLDKLGEMYDHLDALGDQP